MKTPKSNGKPKATSRKSVVQAIAKQEQEVQDSSKNTQNLHEMISLKAYELYLNRGCSQGNDFQDWIAAEKLVLKASR